MCPQQRSEESRAHILQAAAESFARYGYEATGVAEICRRAGLSKGAFYHHFPSKQAVFLELLERWLRGLEAQLEIIHKGDSAIPEQLLHMADMAQSLFAQAGGQLPIFLEFWAQASRDPAVWQVTVAPYRRFRDYFARLIEQGIAEGSFRPVDPELTAQALVSLAVGVLLQGLLDPHGADWGCIMKEAIQMLIRALERSES